MSWTTSTTNLKLSIAVEREKRRRKRSAHIPALADYSANVAGFIHDQIRIDNAQPGDDTATLDAIPFHLWQAQTDLLHDMASERLLLILKARQLGISWLVCAYALWLCLYRPSRLVLFFSIGQGEANEMMRRVSVMYHRLPQELRAGLPRPVKHNTEEIRFDNGSAIQSLPSRKSAGSGYTASLIVLDEFAKNENADALYTAVKPTIDGGGSMIVLSTADGAGNLFYQLVDKARQGQGRFAFRFLPWYVRPGRDQAWYNAIAADAISESHMKQEYPATADEAFEATEVDAFLPSHLLWKALQESLPALDSRTPIVLSADAGEVDDTFAIAAISRHPTDATRTAIRHLEVFYPGSDGVDFVAVKRWLIAFCRSHNVVQVCYDRYQMRLMMQELEQEEGIWVDEFKQQGARLEADKMLRDAAMMRSIADGTGNPAMLEHVMNANAKVESDNRIRIVKRTHALKIDAAVAVSMGHHRFVTEFANL